MSMVIGHNFTFSSQEDANQLLKFFRKEGISARIEPIPQTSYSFIIKGRYESLRSYLSDCMETICNTGETTDNTSNQEASDENGSDVHDEMDLSAEERKEFSEEIQAILEFLLKQKDQATRILEGKNTGDVAFEPAFSENGQNEEDIKAYMRFLFENKILMDNGLFDFTDNLLRFKEIKPVDEYTVGISPGLFPDDEQLDKYEITRIKKINAEIDYTVRAGPEIIGNLDFEKLKKELELIGEEEDYYIHAAHSIALKRDIVNYVLSVMDDSGAETIDDLAEELDMCPGEYETKERTINTYDISYDFVSEIIEDLKKLEIIRIKGNKIKFSKK